MNQRIKHINERPDEPADAAKVGDVFERFGLPAHFD